jgi:hypothetical protein
MLMFVVESGDTKTVGCTDKLRSVIGFQRDEHAEATVGFIITWFVAILLGLWLFNDSAPDEKVTFLLYVMYMDTVTVS